MRFRSRRRLLVSIIGVLLLSPGAPAQTQTAPETITLSVASNFMVPMKVIAEKFELETGHQVSLSFGSSGKLYAQIFNGAPFHIFLSADQEKPMALERHGLTVSGTRHTYAVGRLVLWPSVYEPLEMDLKDMIGIDFNFHKMLQSLGKNDKLAIANPRVAPYGKAAMEVLESLALSEDMAEKIVRGENISQTFQFVDTGNAKLGFVALSQVRHFRDSRIPGPWIVPKKYHAPIRQDMVLLEKGANSGVARAFYEWMQSQEIRELIASYGYELEGDEPDEHGGQ